ncbi:MAG: hypothetical protein ABIT37_07250 [Luteolibacter sp.]
MPLLALLLCYPLAIAGPLSYAMIPLLFWALHRAVIERNLILCAILLLANPLSLFALRAVKDYAGGAPRLQFMGLPNMEFWNIDKKTRCFKTTGGCLVGGDEWVVETPNNLTLSVLCSTFGPPSQSYNGPYPDKSTALRLVSSAPLQKAGDLSQYRFSVGTEVFELDHEKADALGSGLGIFRPFGEDFYPEIVQVRAASFEQRCLILWAAEIDPSDPTKSPEKESLVLIDRKNMRPFCYYRIRGDAMPRFPKLQYLPEHSR